MSDSLDTMLSERFSGQCEAPPGADLADVRRRARHLVVLTQARRLRQPGVRRLPLRGSLLVAAVAVLAGGGTAAAFAVRALTETPASALNGPAHGRDATPADALDLAQAVERWGAELPGSGPGEPLTDRSATLLSDVGSQHDTVSAFPTSHGAVCFEIRAAGTCNTLDGSPGITWAILSALGSTRVYGVEADGVARVQVNVGGLLHEATLRNNGYFYELEKGMRLRDVRGITATWKDGSTREVTMPPGGP